MYLIIPSVNRDNLTSTFPFCIPLISFSCLISLAIALNTVLKGSQESGQACRATYSTFSLLKMMLAMHLSYMTFSMLKYASSSPTLSKTFITNTF